MCSYRKDYDRDNFYAPAFRETSVGARRQRNKKSHPRVAVLKAIALGMDALDSVRSRLQTERIKLNLGWYRDFRPYLHCRWGRF